MGNKSKQDQSSPRHMTDYERKKLSRVRENQEKLKQLGVTNIAKSLTSLVESKKIKKTTLKSVNTTERDVELDCDYREVAAPEVPKKQRPQYIAPMSMHKFAKKQRVMAPSMFDIDTNATKKKGSNMLPHQEVDFDHNGTTMGELILSKNIHGSKFVDTSVAKRNQSRATTMGQLILSKKGPNSSTSGARRKLLLDESDDDTDDFERSLDFEHATHEVNRKVQETTDTRILPLFKTKYILPESDAAKDWVLRSIGADWRGYKCRLKKNHFYQLKDNQTRWKNRPKNIPENDFLQLLSYWNKKEVMNRCLQKRNVRKAQKNMHTAGPKSFARIREEMMNENPNREQPTSTQLFERTRKRKIGNVYCETYDDTAKKIELMKNYQPPEDVNGPVDPFVAVMVKEYDGHCSHPEGY